MTNDMAKFLCNFGTPVSINHIIFASFQGNETDLNKKFEPVRIAKKGKDVRNLPF